MKQQEIDELLSVSEDNCISVIVPAHRLAEDKAVDSLVLDKAIRKLKKTWNDKQDGTGDLLDRLDALYEQVNFSHTLDGLGLYVSPSKSMLVHFPFPVKEKIVLGNSFSSKELLYYKNILDYYVLHVSKKSVHLYNGKGEELNEIVNGDFPLHYIDDYEYAPSTLTSSSSSSAKSFEKDKGTLQEIHLKTFLKSADQLLAKYLTDKDTPLILSGSVKELADFRQVTRYPHQIVGSVMGSYDYNRKEVSDAVAELLKEYTRKKESGLLRLCHELIGKHKLAIGLHDTRKAVNEGKGSVLVLEKDLEFFKPSSSPDHQNQLNGNDMIDQLIKSVLEKNGKVIFVEKGMLKEFDGVALILRY